MSVAVAEGVAGTSRLQDRSFGTALVVGRAVQIYSAEHFVRTHHAWTCAAAPILDPVNGSLLGVVDVSGAASTVHPSTLALVDAAAFGTCRLEPVPGGWLIRVLDDAVAEKSTTVIDIDLSDPRLPRLTMQSQSGSWTHRLSPRHAELLLLLAVNPDGLSATELSAELFGSAEHAVAVRAEASRLRRHLGGVLLHRPYRFAEWVDVRLIQPISPLDLLPASFAPTVRRMRAESQPVGPL